MYSIFIHYKSKRNE